MTVRILEGDCRDVLKTLPEESVHCVVTSPPYWGLRDYGLEPLLWDADESCDHDFTEFVRPGLTGGLDQSFDYTNNQIVKAQAQAQCKKCAAWRGSIGLEPSPQLFVRHLVNILQEARRVLRDDGTLWLNLGDSYCSNGSGGRDEELRSRGKNLPRGSSRWGGGNNEVAWLKPKDLIGIPWRVAMALQDGGWWLRQDIIWSKPNPMPESVLDRCTKAHEYLFLLAKSERYYFDAKAIAEPCVAGDNGSSYTSDYDKATKAGLGTGPRTPRGKAVTSPRNDGNAWNENNGRGFIPTSDTRNKRSVWTVPTQPYTEAHFATFPPALIEPCILAGCPEGGTVLDPFGGAGTTGLVADRHGRNAILIELNPEYAEMARKRIHNDAPLFADVS